MVKFEVGDQIRDCNSEMIVSISDTDVSVGLILDARWLANACASIFYGEPDNWYVNRVIVPKDFRGHGVGGKLLERLKQEVALKGGKKLIVEPGGYAQDLKRQRHFYEKHGFQRVEDHWVWSSSTSCEITSHHIP